MLLRAPANLDPPSVQKAQSTASVQCATSGPHVLTLWRLFGALLRRVRRDFKPRGNFDLGGVVPRDGVLCRVRLRLALPQVVFAPGAVWELVGGRVLPAAEHCAQAVDNGAKALRVHVQQRAAGWQACCNDGGTTFYIRPYVRKICDTCDSLV